ncbi:predicted protein [Sparassis crispa]|uniref:G-patch domain-containing protein n=1 Tax=Sparassis crispa TaxID=139825 RepID=A0A401H060_9APHY|nr:predicted protein [Sparassis crispa]GBE87803.1 predicted protein [Sparassis crispa]
MEAGEIPPDRIPAVHPHAVPSYDHLHSEWHDERSSQDISGTIHSPALEWPGDAGSPPWAAQPSDNSPHPPPKPSSRLFAHAPASLRLLVQKTSVLPKRQTLAVIDGYSEVQFGRDIAPPGSDTPRLRLKEMEVSKLHATMYWDQKREEWAVVDMGSKHGTFLRSSGSAPFGGVQGAGYSVAPDMDTSCSEEKGFRLSPPRVASIPRRLRHLDRLSVGSTTFAVHLHDDQMPCVDCSRQEGKEIPLFAVRRVERYAEANKKRELEATNAPLTVSSQSGAAGERNPKRALTMLKRSLLSRHDSPPTREPTPRYVDRSARRRALHPHIPLDTPHSHLQTKFSPSPASYPVSRSESPFASIPTSSRSAPPTPLPDTNVGHRLLMKQGWQPGTSLGQAESGGLALVEPLEVSGNVGRAGLGMSASAALPPGVGNVEIEWKEDGKFRRWASLRTEDIAR